MIAASERLKHYFEFGSFRVDAAERILLRDGIPVSLSPKAFDTLLLLVENAGRLLSKDELISALWPDTFVEEANLANNVSLLRRVIGSGNEEERYIETIPRRGYRFAPVVREVWGDSRRPGSGSRPVLVNPNAASSPVLSIAVLPFKVFGASETDDYVGLGVADSLITRLGNIREVVVRPTSSVRKYDHSEEDAITAGKELKVDAVLEGSVRRFQDRFRVTVQLVSVQNESPLWADKFDGRCADIFAMEDAISEQVADTLCVRLSGDERKLLTRRYTESTEAYQSYLKGRYSFNKWTQEGFKKAVEHFEESIDKDPSFALAYAGLAHTYGLLAVNGDMATEEAMPKADAAATTALEIDDQLAEAQLAAGAVRGLYRWDLTGARRHLRRSLELNPNFALARHTSALYLTAEGRVDEAFEEIRIAEEIDPLSLMLHSTEAFILCTAGDYERAIERCCDTLDMKPKFYPALERLGDAYLATGRPEKAIESFQRAIALSKRALFPLGALGHAYAVAGYAREAEAIVQELQHRLNKDYVSAWVYSGLGRTQDAFAALERAYQDRDGHMIYLKVDRKLDNLRDDSRLNDLVWRVGAPGQALGARRQAPETKIRIQD